MAQIGDSHGLQRLGDTAFHLVLRHAEVLKPYSTSSSTTDDTICESTSWHTLPTRRLMSVNDASHVSNPSMITLP